MLDVVQIGKNNFPFRDVRLGRNRTGNPVSIYIIFLFFVVSFFQREVDVTSYLYFSF
jgi:hypothetical protein